MEDFLLLVLKIFKILQNKVFFLIKLHTKCYEKFF